jgi:sec-independent protein translocase protein TatA
MSLTHLLIVLGVVALIFGTGKLRNMGSDLGGAARDSRNSVKDQAADQEKPKEPAGELPADATGHSAGKQKTHDPAAHNTH